MWDVLRHLPQKARVHRLVVRDKIRTPNLASIVRRFILLHQETRLSKISKGRTIDEMEGDSRSSVLRIAAGVSLQHPTRVGARKCWAIRACAWRRQVGAGWRSDNVVKSKPSHRK